MLITITHETTYSYDEPVPFALQEVRQSPRQGANQHVHEWEVSVEGGRVEVEFADHHANPVQLISLDTGGQALTVRSAGQVETTDTGGVIADPIGFAPKWLYLRSTELTTVSAGVEALVADFDPGATDPVQLLHDLASHIGGSIRYDPGWTHTASTAEDAVAAGHGVCQDHAHVFVAAARHLGLPARYVSGYLVTRGPIEQEATHAWAEAWVEGLGWVGFDVSNGICPDDHYVRVAVGLDYKEAAPIAGLRFGDANEAMHVSLQVQQ